MSITERESGIQYEHAEMVERMSMAASMSHGVYDSAEDRVCRVVAAERLAKTMKPGEPIIHRLNSLDVVGGHLVDRPGIVIAGQNELAMSYHAQTNTDVVDGKMLFKSLAPGMHPGWEPHHYENMPVLVAGTDDIEKYIWQQYMHMRELETQPGGVPWQSMAPLTELKMFAALAHTDIRMRDVLPPAETIALQIRLYDDYQSHPHLQPLILDAYAGV